MTPQPTVYDADTIRRVVRMPDAIDAMRDVFLSVAQGNVASPQPWHLDTTSGSIHVKGAALTHAPTFAVKMSSGFPGNQVRGLPTSDGFTAVFDAETGAVSVLLLDGGYLTELRTGAAGALAIDLLAPSTVDTMAFIGTGGQIRFQIEGALTVRSPREITVLGRQLDRAQDVARWASERFGAAARAAILDAAPIDADAIVTATAATSPVLRLAQVRPNVHITAVGADTPGKRELGDDLLTAATLLAVDGIEQSKTLGELQSSATHVKPRTVGDLIAARYQRGPRDLTIADLSGIGAQDAGIAAAAVRALELQ